MYVGYVTVFLYCIKSVVSLHVIVFITKQALLLYDEMKYLVTIDHDLLTHFELRYICQDHIVPAACNIYLVVFALLLCKNELTSYRLGGICLTGDTSATYFSQN